MIKPFLLWHAARIEQGQVPLNGLLNCHAQGVHSIMLHDEPGNRVRMFFAQKRHVLWRNDFIYGDKRHAIPKHSMSLAVHPHHCDVRLVGIFGHVENKEFEVYYEGGVGDFVEMRYESAITGNDPSFVFTGRHVLLRVLRNQQLCNYSAVEMSAQQKHTIWIPEGEEAAWLVFEGKEAAERSPYCYTNNPNFNFGEHYGEMSRVFAGKLLRDAAFYGG